MSGLLTAIAVVVSLLLLATASNVTASVTGRDQQRRGTWGIARWTPDRRRPLNPHELRWQTTLMSSTKNDARWGDLVDEIHRLERLSSLPLSVNAPSKPDQKWLEASIARLQATTKPVANQTKTPAGEPVQ